LRKKKTIYEKNIFNAIYADAKALEKSGEKKMNITIERTYVFECGICNCFH